MSVVMSNLDSCKRNKKQELHMGDIPDGELAKILE